MGNFIVSGAHLRGCGLFVHRIIELVWSVLVLCEATVCAGVLCVFKVELSVVSVCLGVLKEDLPVVGVSV